MLQAAAKGFQGPLLLITQNLSMSLLDVTVPPGVAAGAQIEFDGLTVTVPEGVDEGETFQVVVDGGSAVSCAQIMQTFMAWFERESVGDQVDRFVVENAHKMVGHIEMEGEHSHEWWPLYLQYQQQFETLLVAFLEEAGCSQEQFLAAANAAEGMDGMYIGLFLAHSEYDMFVGMMSQEALKQAAENDLSGS